MSYFNTTSVTNPELAEYQSRAMTQEECVLAAMKHIGSATASHLWRHNFSQKCPITSIRRALTCLTKEGLLVKTPNKKIGLWGRPEHVYKTKE